jgi:hypothetical protein
MWVSVSVRIDYNAISQSLVTKLPACGDVMIEAPHKNSPSEHALYLRLFVTNGGGW